MITVFIPHLQDKNRYLDEIILYSNSSFIYGNYKSYEKKYSIVNIQFPEAIFDWKPPTQEQLLELEECFIEWKKKSKIVYTMNDLKKHNNSELMFDRLFQLVHKYADGVIHLGTFSLNEYSNLFSNTCRHKVIFHPIYASLATNDFNTNDVQRIIPFDLREKYIVSAIGSIRSRKEMKLILKIFNNIAEQNKVLIVPRMNQFAPIPKFVPYRFRKLYRNIADKINFYSIRTEEHFIGNVFLEYDYLIDLVKKSNLLIIPRIDNLNSGNLFLGLTFDKEMIVPSVGNLTEILTLFKIPCFDFKKFNKGTLNEFILSIKNKPYYQAIDYEQNKKNLHPSTIAAEHDIFFKSLIEND